MIYVTFIEDKGLVGEISRNQVLINAFGEISRNQVLINAFYMAIYIPTME